MKAKIIAIASQKGGIGKSTTAVNLSSCIAMRATPILLLDLDPQGSTMDWVSIMDRNGQKLFDYLKALESSLETIIKNNISSYNYIIIDCPPRLEKIMAKVISLADLIITPLGLGAVEGWAFDDFNQSVKHYQELNNGKPSQLAFLSNIDIRCKKSIRNTVENIEDLNIKLLQTIYTRNSIFEAAEIGKCTIQMNDEKAITEIELLTTQILEHTNGI